MGILKSLNKTLLNNSIQKLIFVDRTRCTNFVIFLYFGNRLVQFSKGFYIIGKTLLPAYISLFAHLSYFFKTLLAQSELIYERYSLIRFNFNILGMIQISC